MSDEKIKCEICFHWLDEHGELAGSGCCFHSTAYFDNPSLGCFCPGFRAEYAIRSREVIIDALRAELSALRAAQPLTRERIDELKLNALNDLPDNADSFSWMVGWTRGINKFCDALLDSLADKGE